MKIIWVHTSDIHGNMQQGIPSLSQYLEEMEQETLVLTDGGDWLQGSPLAYYSMHVAASRGSLLAEYQSMLPYECMAVGNHDIEQGLEVLRFFEQHTKPKLLCANWLDEHGEPLFRPYQIIERAGIRIAVLGLTTNSVSHWLPAEQLGNTRFVSMKESASYWVNRIQKEEKPHLLVGLFHSGWEGGLQTDSILENATRQVAQEVPGFHLILYGHDHHAGVHRVTNRAGKEVVCAAPSCFFSSFVAVEIEFSGREEIAIHAEVKELQPSASLCPDASFQKWMETPLYYLKEPLLESLAFLGPCPFMDYLHTLQLQISGADVSLAAPSTYCAQIPAGWLTQGDLFRLYPFEPSLKVIRLSHQELTDLLNYTYSLWVNRLPSTQEHAWQLDYVMDDGKTLGFKYHSRFFLSAANIPYTVNLSQEVGQNVNILRTKDEYSVVLSSYYVAGGGNILEKGAKIPLPELLNRIEWDSGQPFLYFVREIWMANPNWSCMPLANWHFEPAEMALPALERDYSLLFPKERE